MNAFHPSKLLLSVLATGTLALVPVRAALNAVTPTTVVSGLSTPTKTLITVERNLLVAEAGTGPNTGRISFVDLATGARRTVVSGLPSGLAAPNNEPSGPSALLRNGRTVYVTIGTGDAVVNGSEPMTTIANPRPSSPLLASVLAITFTTTPEMMTREVALTSADHTALKSGERLVRDIGGGATLTLELLADFDDYVSDPRPNQANNVRASNPFGLALLNGRLFVVDASMNSIRTVDLGTRATGTLTTFAPLPNTRGMGPPVVEAVPDSIRVYGDRLLVTLLTGFAFPIGGAQVRVVDPNTGASTPLITGLTSAIDAVPLPGGGFLTLEYTADMLAGPTAPPSGRLQWFAAPNATPLVLGNSFSQPTHLEIDDRTGTVYITEIFSGRILKVSPFASTQPSQFSNLSVRGVAGAGSETLVAGFTIETAAKQVLVRGIGPRLSAFGVTGALTDPRIVVYDSTGRIVAENDNWTTTADADTAMLTEAAARAGAFPLGGPSRDAALLRMLSPGAYTVHLSGVGGATGIALVEVYHVP